MLLEFSMWGAFGGFLQTVGLDGWPMGFIGLCGVYVLGKVVV